MLIGCAHFFIMTKILADDGFVTSIKMQCRHCRKHLFEEQAGKYPLYNPLAVIEENVADQKSGFVHHHAWELIETKPEEKVYKCGRHVRDWTQWAHIGTYVKPCHATFVEKIEN